MICTESSTARKLLAAAIDSYLKHTNFKMKGEATDSPIILAE